MANHVCMNMLTVNGNDKEIRRFVKEGQNVYRFEGSETEGDILRTMISFEKFMPTPKDLINASDRSPQQQAELILRHGCDNHWRWRSESWGDDADLVAWCRKDKKNIFVFETLYSPPINGFVTVSKLFSSLRFILEYESYEYDEENMAKCGRLIIRDGAIVNEEHWKARFRGCRHCGELIDYIPIGTSEIRQHTKG